MQEKHAVVSTPHSNQRILSSKRSELESATEPRRWKDDRLGTLHSGGHTVVIVSTFGKALVRRTVREVRWQGHRAYAGCLWCLLLRAGGHTV